MDCNTLGAGSKSRRDVIMRYRSRIIDLLEKVREKLAVAGDKAAVTEQDIESWVIQSIDRSWLHPGDIMEIQKIIGEHLYGGIGVIEPLLRSEAVNEIMINGPDDIFVETGGMLRRYENAFLSSSELEAMIRKIAADVHREINEANPIVDARTDDGYRVNGILSNVAINGPVITIRKFSNDSVCEGIASYRWDIPKKLARELPELVLAGYNIFISGGTSTGKTSFLNSLCSAGIGKSERVIVIEDSAELAIKGVENLVSLECRSANSIGKGAISISDLIRTSLRMRPDRIIVGEVRGAEVVDMIQAMNTGHDGSLSTGHGNSIEGMLARLETMYMMGADVPVSAIRKQISNAIDIMIHMRRDANGNRVIDEIAEICDASEDGYELNYIYLTGDTGRLIETGNRLNNREKYNRIKEYDRVSPLRTE